MTMMSSISMVEAKLPPGFRFHPRDEELVCDYLMKKVNDRLYSQTQTQTLLMIEVDLNKCEPWEIPESACVGGKEWYFYSKRDRKYASGQRTNRATASGYWKATGKDRAVVGKGTRQLVGMRKTLVFYQGRAPKGRKTEWVMHEFRLQDQDHLTSPKISSSSSHKEDWVLCRVFCKNRSTEYVGKSPTFTMSTSISYYNQTAGSSSLPELMESYINFDEQVPCFSLFSQNQTQTQTNSLETISEQVLPNFSSDQKVIKAVLNHLTNMGTNPDNIHESPSLAEGSSESYLSDVGMPNNLWTHY